METASLPAATTDQQRTQPDALTADSGVPAPATTPDQSVPSTDAALDAGTSIGEGGSDGSVSGDAAHTTGDGDGDDDDDNLGDIDADGDDAADSSSSKASPNSPGSKVGSSGGSAPSRLIGRKRPYDHSSAVQPMRKRQYVNSVRAVDGVRRHVTVSCMRLAVGGFKCTFTSEERRLAGALRLQRSNAKGGEVIQRRHDTFLISAPAGHDAPFPDYDRVRENFLTRGIDICAHVRSELLPTHVRVVPDASAATDDDMDVPLSTSSSS